MATEVGNLANSTKQSLQVVQNVIERVQQNVSDITLQVNENSEKLDAQNQYFGDVFDSIKNMTELLNTSVDTIRTMGEAHGKQAEVIKQTISINQDITESIRNENEQFNSINAMAESNANDTTKVAMQAGVISEMVEQMTLVLGQES